MKNSFTVIIPTLILLLFINLHCVAQNSTSEASSEIIQQHNIELHIIPSNSYLYGSDSITFNYDFSGSLTFSLMSSLEIKSFETNDNYIKFRLEKADSIFNNLIIESSKNTLINKNISSNTYIKFVYEGKVYNPPSVTNLTERHSRSAGIISPNENEGIYLPSAAFYPTATKELANFVCKVTIAQDYTIISSGNREESIKGENKFYTFKTEFPLDGLIIVGGKYITKSITHDNVQFFVHTYNELQHSDSYLSSMKEYYDRYQELLGEYPFKEFHIVENFFATGFGMPGYTLISGRLLVMPWVFLSPGSLAHEFVHNWWGNSVFTDYEAGNWVEALTTFCTNYYWNEISENEIAAKDWRKKALISIDALPEEQNYPLKDFSYQRTIFDAVIGYSKGAFFFYEIYKILGKELFFEALQEIAQKYKGKRAFWNDLEAAFITRAEKPHLINKLFKQWTVQNIVPRLKLESVTQNNEHLKINITQDSDFYLSVPIKLIGAQKEEIIYKNISLTENVFEIQTSFKVNEIQLDPDYQVLRKLYDWEKPYNLNRTINDSPIIVVPSQETSDYDLAMEFVEMLRESGYDFPVYTADAIRNDIISLQTDYDEKYLTYTDINSDEVIRHSSLIVLGSINNNQLLEKMTDVFPKDIIFSDENIIYNGTSVAAKEHLLKMSIDHPSNKNKLCSVIYFENFENSQPFRRLFHYLNNSLVLLSNTRPGRPVYESEVFPSGFDKSEMRRKINY